MWKSVAVFLSRNVHTTGLNLASQGRIVFSKSDSNSWNSKPGRRSNSWDDDEGDNRGNRRSFDDEEDGGFRRKSNKFSGGYRSGNRDESFNSRSNFSANRNKNYGSDDWQSSKKERNANFEEIGTSSKWNVGANFAKESERLKQSIHAFRHGKKFGFKRDSGVRRQVKAYGRDSDPNDFQEDDLEAETDVMKFDKIYDSHQQEKEVKREHTKMKIVQQKYFKEPQESTLSWSDKEHIRYLHNTDPQTWTFEMIAEHFRVDVQIAKAVATAKWLPKKQENGEEIPPTPEQPLLTATGDNPENSTVELKRTMTWKEMSASNSENKEEVDNSQTSSRVAEIATAPAKEAELLEGDEKDLIMRFLSKEDRPQKWAMNESKSPKLKVDTNEQDVNVYYYDSKHGYQHPLGKKEDSDEQTPAVTEGELHRKGDSFYTPEGEFLYRIPGLTK